jgi:hypothetical protein
MIKGSGSGSIPLTSGSGSWRPKNNKITSFSSFTYNIIPEMEGSTTYCYPLAEDHSPGAARTRHRRRWIPFLEFYSEKNNNYVYSMPTLLFGLEPSVLIPGVRILHSIILSFIRVTKYGYKIFLFLKICFNALKSNKNYKYKNS